MYEYINEIKITGLIGHRLERRVQELQHSRSHDKKVWESGAETASMAAATVRVICCER